MHDDLILNTTKLSKYSFPANDAIIDEEAQSLRAPFAPTNDAPYLAIYTDDNNNISVLTDAKNIDPNKRWEILEEVGCRGRLPLNNWNNW